MSKSAVWSLSARVSYSDGTFDEVAAVKDFGDLRYVGNEDLFGVMKKGTAFKEFLNALGYTPVSGSNPTTVNGYEFRFSAICTDGQLVYVAGSDKAMAPNIDSNDLSAVLAVLNEDTEFVALFTDLAS